MMSSNSNRFGESTDCGGYDFPPEVESDPQERYMAREYLFQGV